MTQPVRSGGNRRSLSPGLRVVVAVCLAAPLVALLWVGSYAKVEPRLWGFPFFYWYQFLWVFITAGLTYLAFRIIGTTRGGGGGPDGSGGIAPVPDSPDASATSDEEVPL